MPISRGASSRCLKEGKTDITVSFTDKSVLIKPRNQCVADYLQDLSDEEIDDNDSDFGSSDNAF